MEFKNQDAVRLDSNGNIDTSALERELLGALEFDKKYKLQDNMKKRAVKQAPSYDDFRNMVACAHLKKVTRQDIESLSKSKKGWQKNHGFGGENDNSNSSNTSARILNEELRLTSQADENAVKAISSNFKIPKTTMELGRDIRRKKEMKEKLSYLENITLKTAKKLFKKGDVDTDLLEELLLVATSEEAKAIEARDNQKIVLKEERSREEGEIKKSYSSSSSFPILKWLKLLTNLPRFALNIKFASVTTIDSVKGCLKQYINDESNESESKKGDAVIILSKLEE